MSAVTEFFGKGGGAKVYDYLFSIDFGICHGPIDSVNIVWVKDKPIFCGKVQARDDVAVDNPDIFGGDDAEGGVKGTVEVYMGADDQVSSTELAARVGRTPETMPGYRGLAHLFFRGASGRGFRWSTNNPYMPATHVHVTRRSVALGEDLSMVAPFSHYDGVTGEPVPYDNILFSVSSAEVNLVDEDGGTVGDTDIALTGYYTGSQIDAGGLYVQVSGFGDAHYKGLAGDGPADGVLSADVVFLDEGGAVLGSAYAGGASGTGYTEFTGDFVSVPAGTHTVRLEPDYVLTISLFAEWSDVGFNVTVTADPASVGGGSGTAPPSHCAPEDEGLSYMPNSNPAHIIYECLVNAEWGKGEDPVNIDTASFLASAGTLYDELFGLSMMWTRQSTIEGFAQEVLDHIQGMLFQHPATGLWTLRLLRDDYNAAAAPLLDPSNCTAKKRKRKAWGETINEIVVQYTDPRTEEDATVAAHNLANISIQGGVLSETRNYYGVRDPWLALRIAERDVLSSGYPLYSATLEVDRTQWDVVPGDVRRFSWPEDGVEEMVVRVMKVDYGTRKDRTIKLEVVEDVFALAQTSYGEVQGTEWTTDRAVAVPLDAETAMAIPAPIMVRNGVAVTEIDNRYPGVAVLLMGCDDEHNTVDIEVHTAVVKPNGSTVVEAVRKIPPLPSELLDVALVAEAASTLSGGLVDKVFYGNASVGDLLVLGETEALHEIVMLDSYDAALDEWTVARGVYDTIPRDWGTGNRVWEMPVDGARADPAERTGGETRTYRLLPRTLEGRLPYAEAADVTVTLSERPHLPFRPANTQLAGAGFGVLEEPTGVPATVEATWVNRNRATEDSLVQRWGEATVTPETGQTTTLQVFDETDTLQNTISGLAGTSYTMADTDFAGVEFGYVRFLSVRDGLASLMGADRWFDFRAAGYGASYGTSYG